MKKLILVFLILALSGCAHMQEHKWVYLGLAAGAVAASQDGGSSFQVGQPLCPGVQVPEGKTNPCSRGIQ